MKTSIALLAMFLLPSFYSFSQKISDDITIEWGEESKIKNTAPIYPLITDSSGIYFLEHSIPTYKIGPQIFHYGKNLNFIKSRPLSSKKELKKLYWNSIFTLPVKDELFATYSKTDFKLKKEYFTIQKIDKETLIRSPENKIVESINNESRITSFDNETYKTSFRSFLTNNYSEIGLLKAFDNYLLYKRFDSKLNLIAEKKISISNAEDVVNSQVVFEEENKIFVLISKFQKRLIEKEKGSTGSKYKLLILDFETGKSSEHDLSPNGKILTDLTFNVEKDEIICSSFYSYKNSNNAAGFFIKRINHKTNQIIQETTKQFSKKLITQLLKERKVKKIEAKINKGEIPELFKVKLRKTIIRKDQGILLIGQKDHWTVSEIGSSNINEELIVISLSKSGTIEWEKKIPIKQRTTFESHHWGSFLTFLQNDKLNILFNDNALNSYRETPKTLKGTKRFDPDLYSVVKRVIIDKEGNQKNEILLPTKENKFFLCPETCFKNGDKEIIFLGTNQYSLHKLGKITFKEPIEVQ